MTPNVSFTNLFLRIYAFLFTAVDLASVMGLIFYDISSVYDVSSFLIVELSAPVHCISCTSLNADQLLRRNKNIIYFLS
jgi:hypothetical protein